MASRPGAALGAPIKPGASTAVLEGAAMGQPLRDRPTRHEQAPDLLRPGADTAFRCPGDPEAVAVVVAWRGGLRQPPAGLLTPTQGEPMTARPMPRLAEQLPRRAGYAAGQLQQLVRGAQQLVADLNASLR